MPRRGIVRVCSAKAQRRHAATTPSPTTKVRRRMSGPAEEASGQSARLQPYRIPVAVNSASQHQTLSCAPARVLQQRQHFRKSRRPGDRFRGWPEWTPVSGPLGPCRAFNPLRPCSLVFAPEPAITVPHSVHFQHRSSLSAFSGQCTCRDLHCRSLHLRAAT